MKASSLLATVVLAGGLLSGCGETDQTLKPEARGKAGKVWEANGGQRAYVAPGWKAGDEASWRQQLQDRTQYGQNEYNRTSAAR